MKVYWNYQCDYAHQWVIFRDENAEENPEDQTCPYGHEAVTIQKDIPIDEIVISFLPAGVIYDRVTQKVSAHGKYWFAVTNRLGGDEEKRSKKSYNWLEVMDLANKFHGLNKQKAWILWEKLGL